MAALKLRALIADDELLARERIRTLLGEDPEVEVVGECGDGATAARMIDALSPDLLLLDVQMPELDGLSALAQVPEARRPRAVLLVTAHEEHAIEAFDLQAVDYLLKPFEEARFWKALLRAKERLRQPPPDLLALIDEVRAQRERLAIRSGAHTTLVRYDEIDWAEAADNYVELHAGGLTHLMRETLSRLEARLSGAGFVRVHRSTLVNVRRIRELRPLAGGDQQIVLLDGTLLVLSRTHRENLRMLLRMIP
jgi:two-component system LytT family response regulator